MRAVHSGSCALESARRRPNRAKHALHAFDAITIVNLPRRQVRCSTWLYESSWRTRRTCSHGRGARLSLPRPHASNHVVTIDYSCSLRGGQQVASACGRPSHAQQRLGIRNLQNTLAPSIFSTDIGAVAGTLGGEQETFRCRQGGR
jgi:hypothetical protein